MGDVGVGEVPRNQTPGPWEACEDGEGVEGDPSEAGDDDYTRKPLEGEGVCRHETARHCTLFQMGGHVGSRTTQRGLSAAQAPQMGPYPPREGVGDEREGGHEQGYSQSEEDAAAGRKVEIH